ncbi:hypothetical protein TWF730_002849 [Orbilia blumenaviensis]|uniref:F-box domain-containing protein n=1 Tax=Orbilia blumenaviensis TaxID=1796055 RepID=A0AAV9UBS0_9PEZI
METFQLLDLDPPKAKTNITSLPLELLEDISIYVGKANFEYSWNLCTINRYLYDTIGPSNNFLWYEIVGRFELGKATKFIKYHPDFNYATLARRKSSWPDPKCCGCEVSGEPLKMIQNWSQFRTLVFLLFCEKCLDKHYVCMSRNFVGYKSRELSLTLECLGTALTSIAELRATDPVLQHFFSSHPALNSICHVYWNRRSELVSKELYNHVKNIFKLDASEPFRLLTDSEIKEIQEQASRFKPTFIPSENHRHLHDRKYHKGVCDIYRREYTSFHFLCAPSYFEELWKDYDKMIRRVKLGRNTPPVEDPDHSITETHDPRLAFNNFRYYFHRKPRCRGGKNKIVGEGDYQTQLGQYEGQKAIVTRHKYCQQALVSLFGPGDGIVWNASRVQWPEFLMALFDQWHRMTFGLGLWLPDQPVARCPYCFAYFQGSVSGDTNGGVTDRWRSEPKNILDHITGEHRDMLC